MKIGAIAKEPVVPAKTIRYYESVGLLEAPPRSGGNYRVYDEHDVATLGFVQRARGLGFSIKEAESLVTLWRDRQRASADVQALAASHLEAIENKLHALQAMRDTLHHLVESCHGDARPDCPIIDELATSRAR